uniref:Uncharacterized protein n=1 Tax=Utricularia reniformis TaxID=192314 RepID=A0A1Y0B1J4_9LAMI|nr:hypothetical protein AEK19_MT1105 [Utricularia reniformis]ART31325.1 hypothetical protein AEK19_MT1105 [Utricularia reniformis]
MGPYPKDRDRANASVILDDEALFTLPSKFSCCNTVTV